MKALVLEKNGELKLRSRDTPTPVKEACVLVKIAACGICGSDITRGFKRGAYHYPLVMGHEFCGEVVEEDTRSDGFKVGDRVVIFPLIPCEICTACQTGDYAQCINYNYFGSRCDGGFEEFLYVPPSNLLLVPPHVTMLHAAMTEPAAVALHGVKKMKISAGDTGVVFGAGPIGNMTGQWLRIHGCHRVIMVDTDDLKLEVAETMGFEIVNSQTLDPVEKIIQLTEGKGAERVVEAVGLPITFLQAIKVATRFGEIVFMGNLHGTFRIDDEDFTHILRNELSIYGTWNSKVTPRGIDDWSTVLKYMDKSLKVGPLISDTPTLDMGQEIFESILNRKKFHHKVIFKIGEQ